VEFGTNPVLEAKPFNFCHQCGDGNPVQHAFFQTGHRRGILKDIQSFEIFLQEDEVDCVFQEELDDHSFQSPQEDAIYHKY